MPPTTTAPSRKRSSKPYDSADRPKSSGSTSTSKAAVVGTEAKVASTSAKARPSRAHDSAGAAGRLAKEDDGKLQRIKSNESYGKREADDSDWKKNKKKRRKPSIPSSSAHDDSLDKKRVLGQPEKLGNGVAIAIDKEKLPSSTSAKPAAAHPPSSPGTKPMVHTAMDQHIKALNRKTAEIERLQTELVAAKEEAVKKEKVMKERVRELERENAAHREEKDGKDKKLEEHRLAQEALAEACQCGVCMDTLDDPHTLSCGHIACKKCLISWFRTAGAYPSFVPSPVPADLDLSYWRKSCHVCRAIVIHRPTRLFFLGDILGPLGIDPKLPSSSQQAAADPWEKIFPPERNMYRIYDDTDHVERCPSCGFEIMDGICTQCNAEFSADEEEFEEDGFAVDDSDEEHDDGVGLVDGPDGLVLGLGRRRPHMPWGAYADVAEAFIADEASVSGDDDLTDENDDEAGSQVSNDEEGSVDYDLRHDEILTGAIHRARNRSPRQDIDMDLDRHRLRRMHHPPAEEEEGGMEDEEEDQYEDSFINDGSDDEDGGFGETESGDSIDSSGTDSARDSDDDNSESESEASSGMELDRPPADEMRRRRLGRIEQRAAAPAAAVRRAAFNEPQPAARPARRARPIIIDSDED